MIERHRRYPPESSPWWAASFRAREVFQRSWLVVPSVYVFSAVALGILLPKVDEHGPIVLDVQLSPASASVLLQAIAAGMITFTGMVVSIAVLVVQFGAGTYTPRLVLWFRRDPLVKHSLGLFVAPALYSLVALFALDIDGTLRPNVTVTIAMLLLVIAIAAFFVMIGRLLDLLRPRKLYQRLSEAVHRSIDMVYPHSLHDPEPLPETPGHRTTIFHRGQPGVISAIDRHHLLRQAVQSDLRIDIFWDVGTYLADGAPAMAVTGEVSDSGAFERGIIINDERTVTQDPNFGIRAIVDIAIHALSPAVNDPTTAVQALDTIEAILHQASGRNLGTSVLRDDGGVPRVVIPASDWDELLDLALSEIRAYGANSLQVTRRLAAVLSGLAELAPEARQAGVRRHRRLLELEVESEYSDPELRAAALTPDRLGLGGSSGQSDRWLAARGASVQSSNRNS